MYLLSWNTKFSKTQKKKYFSFNLRFKQQILLSFIPFSFIRQGLANVKLIVMTMPGDKQVQSPYLCSVP